MSRYQRAGGLCPLSSTSPAGATRRDPTPRGSGAAPVGFARSRSVELPRPGGSGRDRWEPGDTAVPGPQRSEVPPDRKRSAERKRNPPGRGTGDGSGEGSGERVPAHPAGAGAARGLRRLEISASFPCWQGGEEAGSPRLVPLRVPAPLPEPPGPASKVEAEPAAEGGRGRAGGGTGRPAGTKPGRWGWDSPGVGPGQGSPPGGRAIRHGRRFPRGPVRLLAPLPRRPLRGRSRPAPSGRRRCPGANPARAELRRGRPSPGVKPDGEGLGRGKSGEGGGGGGGRTLPSGLCSNCKGENWRQLGSKTRHDPRIGE